MITFIQRFRRRGAEMARTSDVEGSTDQNLFLVYFPLPPNQNSTAAAGGPRRLDRTLRIAKPG